MSLRLVRIDDRLIHGQVVAVWLRTIAADRIVIVDDASAADEFLREVLVLAAPPSVPVEVHDVAHGIERCIELAASDDAVMVLVRSPRTALALRESGVPIDTVNLGGLGAGPGRSRLYRSISVSNDDLADLRALERLGTRVEIRIVADDRPVAFAALDASRKT